MPSWIRTWYLVNLFVLIPDWMYIMLRPRSLEGGDLAYLFRILNIYARVDKLFSDYKNKFVHYIYLLGTFDIAICFYLWASFQRNAATPAFAIACICREVFVSTKTALYLLYSFDFIAPRWRVPVYLMNSLFVLLPAVIVWQVSRAILDAFASDHFESLGKKA